MKWKNLFINISIAFISLILSFAIIELVLYSTEKISYLKERIEYKMELQNPPTTHPIVIYSPIEEIYYELNPNFLDTVSNIHVSINSLGFRDYEYSMKKSNNTFRIIIVGDSMTFGDGVLINETFSKVLEKKLNKFSNMKYEVLNFGVPGYNIMQVFGTIKYKIKNYDPDILIYAFFYNDPKFERNNPSINLCKKYSGGPYFTIRILDLVNKINLKKMEHSFKEYWDSDPGLICTKSLFSHIINETQKFKTKPIPIFFITTIGPSLTNKDNSILYEAKKVGFKVINSSEYINVRNLSIENLTINDTNRHYPVYGHKIIAEMLYEFLINESLIPT